ncbi:hypothetical protein [Larkinella humicola]|uniref:Uncharacterized protein n=1 Tax=Larkinella humicola TaxID=2607654 RepID=A0A5N1JGB6_9BACT|nr:hypothetical protein [Larkinella humicola]KAA9352788.1 hypothetical protein F0P93_16505 [Larkinella humicola]
MSRKLVLTPFENGYLAALHEVFNESPMAVKNQPIDISHFLLSALTMAGVDSIQSFGELSYSKTKLIKKNVSKLSRNEWSRCSEKVQDTFDKYRIPNISKEMDEEISSMSHRVSQLFYAMKSNSGILSFFEIGNIKNKHLLPPELALPLEILFLSIQIKTTNLPVLRYDIEKKDINKLIEVLNSKEFEVYSEAQSELETNSSITNKTINAIEKAGKDLYKKNIRILDIKESVIKTIPLTSKVIDLYFGKMPGILAEYGGKILIDYLGLNKTIPIYSCDTILTGMLKSRLGIITRKSVNANQEL